MVMTTKPRFVVFGMGVLAERNHTFQAILKELRPRVLSTGGIASS